MKIEIKSAAAFLVDLLKLNNSGLTEVQLEKFRDVVCDILVRHYTDHWFPEQPFKGSGYRCIRINGKLDPLIAKAGFTMGIAMSFLRSLFPSELTMWVDPKEVSYRIGENGSICVLYEEEVPAPPPAKPISPPKALPSPPPQQTASPPPTLSHPIHQHHQHLQHHQELTSHHHHHHQHHFSPSKSVVVSAGLHHSPPLSPITTQQQATAAALSMFFMNGKDNGNLVKCKESLRGGLDVRRLQLDPLFVSS